MRIRNLAGFAGVNCAVDPRILPENVASDMQDVTVENGAIRPRYGYRNLLAAQSGFSAVLGLGYLQGYSSTTEVEEYVTAETVSGNTRFYSRPADDGDPATEIKNGVSSVNVNASEWVFNVFNGESFFINPLNSSAPVYRHSIGSLTSLTAIAVPADPTVAPTYIIKYGGGSTPYTQFNFAGVDVGAEIAYTGSAHSTDSSIDTDNSLIVGHAAGNVESSFEVDFNGATAGIQDYTYNDKFAFSMTTLDPFRIDATSIRVQFSNNDGSPKTLIPDYTTVKRSVGGSSETYLVQFGWTDKTRADFDNVRKMKVTYSKLSDSGAARLKVSPVWEGGIDMQQPASERLPGSAGLYIAYTYYFSTPLFESGFSPQLFIPNSVLKGYSPGAGIDPLGVQLEITMTVSGDANVDNFRIYLQDNGGPVWRRAATQADSDATYDVRLTYTEITRLTEYAASPFTLAGATNAFPYKGSFVWLYLGGQSNVRFSRVGDALRQAAVTDTIEDENRGATFTLADNYGDEPLGGTQTGDACMIAGKYGVYVLFGDFPAQMTPPRKVSGSFGVAGKYAFCRWKDDNGVPGMAYVSRDGQVYFAIPGGISGQDAGDNIILSGTIRTGVKSLKEFLLDGQSALSLTDFSTAQVFVDEQNDALWVVMGKRALVLRRPDIDGVRHWEPRTFNTGGATVAIRYCNGSTKRRVRWIRSDGKFDEAEFNSSTSAYITGSNRDGGNAMPTPYWTSKCFVDKILRTVYVKVSRDTLTNAPTVTDYSTGVTAGTSKTIASGSIGTMFPVVSNGSEHTYKVALGESYDPVRRIEIELHNGGNRRLR